jgi:hypothetical protein
MLRLLRDDQKVRQNKVLAEMPQELKNELDYLTQVEMGDESWFFAYDPETKRLREEWHMPVSKTKESLHKKIKIKTMVIIFLFSRVIHKGFVPPGVTMN